MKKWNRILAAVLTLSLTAGLTACGGSTSDATASDATANNASAADEGTASNGSSEVYRTLDEIKESGTINIGVFSDKNPFGYVDEMVNIRDTIFICKQTWGGSWSGCELRIHRGGKQNRIFTDGKSGYHSCKLYRD